MGRTRDRYDLDAIKGLSILFVILYHAGVMPNGYLAVDTFFVINGFFIIPSVCKNLDNGTFRYFQFLIKRIFRLLPLVLFASIVCMLVGAWGMMPDDYENLSESVVATNLFANNILQAITTKNYWEVVMDYKPLMHTWYLGILVQFYVIFPLFLILWHAISPKNFIKRSGSLVGLLLLISFLLFLFYPVAYEIKFYYLPFRFWEICLGGLVGLYVQSNGNRSYLQNFKSLSPVAFLIFCLWILSILMGFNMTSVDKTIPIGSDPIIGSNNLKELKVIWIVLLSLSFLLYSKISHSVFLDKILKIKSLQFLGKISLSLFIWHQIFFAFYRYYVSKNFTVPVLLASFLIIVFFSYLTYKFIEKKNYLKTNRIVMVLLLNILVIVSAFTIYSRAGVIRDIPELGIYYDHPLENRNTEYIDKIYNFDKNFTSDSTKIKVLVVGKSFARDFASVLLESDVKDLIEISYAFNFSKPIINRVKKCDYLFTFSSKKNVPAYVWKNVISSTRVWGIGTKNFGESNGIVYSKRYSGDYFTQTVPLNSAYRKLNEKWKEEWQDHYIDFIKLSTVENNRIRIFTPENRFISADCRHLTKAGAQFFAKIINFEKILNIHGN